MCYAFITQTIQRKNEQKKRLLAGLKGRSRTFKFMLSGFPNGFLSKELTVLVQRSLAEVSEQLAKLDPDDPKHLQDFQIATAALAEKHKESGTHTPPQLETHQQIKEVKACMEELNKFIVRLQDKNTISSTQAKNYKLQIAQLMLQITVDGYELHGEKAISVGKTKLSIHYFEIALNLLIKDGRTGHFQKRVDSLRSKLKEQRARLAEEDPNAILSEDERNEQNEVKEAWDKISDGEDLWKKKNVYD